MTVLFLLLVLSRSAHSFPELNHREPCDETCSAPAYRATLLSNVLWADVILAQEKLLVILTACKIYSGRELRTRLSASLSADLWKPYLQTRRKQHLLHLLQTRLSLPARRRLPPWQQCQGFLTKTVYSETIYYICQGKHMSKQCFFLLYIPKWSLRSRRSQLPKGPTSCAETRQHPGGSRYFAQYLSMWHCPTAHHLKVQDILQWQKLGPPASPPSGQQRTLLSQISGKTHLCLPQLW